MTDEPAVAQGSRRQPDLYWKQLKQLKQLKASSICIRIYRNQLNRRISTVEVVKAIASSGAIGAWVLWREYPFVWTAIIAAAQVLDAIKGVFPFSRLHKSAAALTIALETLQYDAEDEWESIYRGSMRDEDITKRRTKLRKLQLDAEQKHFPEGFEPSAKLIALATAEANDYFNSTYSQEVAQ